MAFYIGLKVSNSPHLQMAILGHIVLTVGYSILLNEKTFYTKKK